MLAYGLWVLIVLTAAALVRSFSGYAQAAHRRRTGQPSREALTRTGADCGAEKWPPDLRSGRCGKTPWIAVVFLALALPLGLIGGIWAALGLASLAAIGLLVNRATGHRRRSANEAREEGQHKDEP